MNTWTGLRGLADRCQATWLAVTVDGRWITAAGTDEGRAIWRSSDDLLEGIEVPATRRRLAADLST